MFYLLLLHISFLYMYIWDDLVPVLISLPSSFSRMERAYQCVHEGVTLPALHPRMPNGIAERLKRAQALRGRTGQ